MHLYFGVGRGGVVGCAEVKAVAAVVDDQAAHFYIGEQAHTDLSRKLSAKGKAMSWLGQIEAAGSQFARVTHVSAPDVLLSGWEYNGVPLMNRRRACQ